MEEEKEREIVLPGQIIGTGTYKPSKGAFKVGNNIYASVLGVPVIKRDCIGVRALFGTYIPNVGDTVIGYVKDVHFSNWIIDINSAYLAVLQLSDATRNRIDPLRYNIRRIFDVGDALIGTVIAVTRTMQSNITTIGKGLGKITSGRVVEIEPTKVPRVIGRKGSMIRMIKEKTACKILVGQNGRVWIDGKPEMQEIVVKALRKIEKEAHTTGLTNEISNLLKEEIE